MNIYEMLKYFFYNLITLFIPNICFNCQEELPKNQFYICKKCLDSLPRYQNDREYIFSLFEFNKVTQKLIWLLKYDRRVELGLYLGEYLSSELRRLNLLSVEQEIELFPIPLSKKRYKKRGYNQSYLLSLGICRSLENICSINETSQRIKDNVSQTTLSRNMRKQNVVNIFQLGNVKNNLKKQCIVIDDVVTTGSTISSFFKELKKVKNLNHYFAITLISAQKIKYNYQEGV